MTGEKPSSGSIPKNNPEWNLTVPSSDIVPCSEQETSATCGWIIMNTANTAIKTIAAIQTHCFNSFIESTYEGGENSPSSLLCLFGFGTTINNYVFSISVIPDDICCILCIFDIVALSPSYLCTTSTRNQYCGIFIG